MSYDYYLGFSDKSALIKEDDLVAKLGDSFTVSQVKNDSKGWVQSFTATEKGKTTDWEFSRQEAGYFWAGCVMSGDGATKLGGICQKLAAILGWQINDPQLDEEKWVIPNETTL